MWEVWGGSGGRPQGCWKPSAAVWAMPGGAGSQGWFQDRDSPGQSFGARLGPSKGGLRGWAGPGRHPGTVPSSLPGQPRLRVIQNDPVDRFVCCLLIYSDSFMEQLAGSQQGSLPAHLPQTASTAEILTAQRAQPPRPAPLFLGVLGGRPGRGCG